MSDRAWLDGLKPGDEVAVDVGPGLSCKYHLLRVDRRTATQIVCVYPGSTSEAKFRAKDGIAVSIGSSCTRRFLVPMTSDVRAELQQHADRSRLRFTDWDRVNATTLRAICELLSKDPAP